MPDFTPDLYKSRYEIYPGKTDTGSAEEIIKKLQADISSIGRTINFSVGNRFAQEDRQILH